MKAASYAILAHHETPAIMWGLGGKHYDDVSFAVSDALAHAAQRLNARAGERILDVATGTGWSARNVARTGAAVTGVDISRELLLAARELSGHLRPAIDFRQGDAKCLPFDDGAFDGVISTFGVMFAVNQARAAAELARVCRSGGRLVLATWASAGAVAEFFGIISRYRDAPPARSSPLAWGDPAYVEGLLGKAFDLTFEQGVSDAYHGSADDIWDWYTRGFGPLRQLVESLPPDPSCSSSATSTPTTANTPFRRGCAFGVNICSPSAGAGKRLRSSVGAALSASRGECGAGAQQ